MRRLWTDHSALAVRDYQQALELFMLRRSKNLSQHTLGWYKTILGCLTRFLEASGGPSPRLMEAVNRKVFTNM